MEVDKPPQTSYVALTHQLSHGCSDSLMGEERETDVFCLGCGGPGMAVGFCEAVECACYFTHVSLTLQVEDTCGLGIGVMRRHLARLMVSRVCACG